MDAKGLQDVFVRREVREAHRMGVQIEALGANPWSTHAAEKMSKSMERDTGSVWEKKSHYSSPPWSSISTSASAGVLVVLRGGGGGGSVVHVRKKESRATGRAKKTIEDGKRVGSLAPSFSPVV